MSIFNFKGILIIISIIFFISIIYVFHSFNAIFDSRTCFIYHPKTERIYKLDLSFYPSFYEVWEPLLLDQPVYNEPVGGRYLGKLSNVLDEIAAEKKLLRKNNGTWRKKLMNETEKFLNKLENKNLTFYDFQYYIKKENINQNELENSTKLLDLVNYNRSDFKIIDVVINKWKRKLNAKVDREILERSKILKNALLIQGYAAHNLADILEVSI